MQMGALVPFAGLFVKQRGGAADAKCAVKFFLNSARHLARIF